MKILKKLFGRLSEKSNKSPEPETIAEKELDIDLPMIYTITVDDDGQVSFYFQCKEGYEIAFGNFLNQLLSGIYDEQIVVGMSSVFDRETFIKIVSGMKTQELQSPMSENPIIMPSQVFSEIKKT